MNLAEARWFAQRRLHEHNEETSAQQSWLPDPRPNSRRSWLLPFRLRLRLSLHSSSQLRNCSLTHTLITLGTERFINADFHRHG
jgi:hypothetical protein